MFILLISIGIDQNHALAEERQFTRKQVNSDIDFLVKTLKRYHPNLYAHRTKKEFASIVEAVRNKVPENLDTYSVLPVFQTILAAACDEHTTIQFKLPFTGKGQPDFNKIFEDKEKLAAYLHPRFLKENLIVTADDVFMDSSAMTFNRQTLHAINEYSANEVQGFVRAITIADGCSTKNTIFTRLLPKTHRILLSSMLNISKYHKMAVKGAGDKDVRKYNAALQSLIKLFRTKSPSRSVTKKIEMLKTYGIEITSEELTSEEDSKFHGIIVKSNPDKSLYYIYSYSFLGEKKQTKKTNKLLRKMIASKPDHVILDLTNNPGGRLRTASHLLSYFLSRSHTIAKTMRMRNTSSKTPAHFTYLSKVLRNFHKKRKRNFRRVSQKNGQRRLRVNKLAFGNPDYKGALSVLVSPRTRSAGTVVANVLKRKRQATLVGYLNAGSTKTSCFAPTGYFTLPTTKIRINIPDICYDRPKNASQKGKLLNLDIPVDPLGSPASLLNFRILEAALLNLDIAPQ